MLEIKNLSVSVEDKEILRDINLNINDGEIHALLGPNGIGKSTICRTIMSSPNYKITTGAIYFDNNKLNDMDTSSISRLGIQLISQNPIAIEGVTNAEMLRTALSEKENKHIDIFAFNKKMEEICKRLELPKSFIHRNINDGMSGGERKKNELLHIWMLEPKFIILDEIDSGLDVDALKVVATSLKEYQSTHNASILIITHSTKILEILKPDYVHVLDNKQIIKTGDYSLAEIIQNNGFNNLNKALEVGDNK